MDSAAKTKKALPIFTGFLYNPRLLYAPGRSLPLLINGILPYSNYMYQPRFYTVQPSDHTAGTTAGQTDSIQLRMIPGSLIIGLRLATFAGFPPSSLSYLIRDSNTQLNFTDGKSRFINCQQLVPSGATGAPFTILNKPYEVGGGVIVFSVSNLNTNTAANYQMLVYVLEPVQSETAEDTGSIMVPRHAVAVGGAN